MLAPRTYNKDCHKKYGRLIGHCLSNLEELEQKRQRTKTIWDSEYPDKPFELAEDLSKMYVVEIYLLQWPMV